MTFLSVLYSCTLFLVNTKFHPWWTKWTVECCRSAATRER